MDYLIKGIVSLSICVICLTGRPSESMVFKTPGHNKIEQ